MKKILNDEIKIIELNILKDVDKFCNNNNICYYLCGGTLLGAVRHQGFIPWDDDVDIAMPRKDYNKFINTYNQSASNYKVRSIENSANWHMSFARVEDNRTILFEETLKRKYRECHVFVDVFPIDGVPENEFIEKGFMLKQKLLGIIMNASAFCFFPSKHFSDSKENYISIKNSMRTILKYIAIVLFSCVNTQYVIKLINRNSSKYEFGSTKEVGLTVFVWNWSFEKAEFLAFKNRRKFKFEDSEFWGPSGYDEYLTKTYGDYMTPPPIRRQVSHHSFLGFWK